MTFGEDSLKVKVPLVPNWKMQATGAAVEAGQVKAFRKHAIFKPNYAVFLYFFMLTGTEKVRDGGYDNFPGSRREEEQRNSYSAFDYNSSESGRGEVDSFGDSFDLPSVRRQFIRSNLLAKQIIWDFEFVAPGC